MLPIVVPPSPSADFEATKLRSLFEWTVEQGVITSLLPSVDVLVEQHVLLRSRLEAAAKAEPYKSLWAAELAGGGYGTNVMRQLFTEPRFYEGTEAWLLLFNYMALKTANEAVVESIGCIVDQHAAPGRHLAQHVYAAEAFVHWNGPRPHAAEKLLAASLDRHFKGKDWHFHKADRGARESSVDRQLGGKYKQFKVSKVVDRLAAEPSRVSFMAD